MIWLCSFRHRWPKWGPQVQTRSQRMVLSGGEWKVSPIFEKDSQERTCLRCGAIERRQVPYKDDPNP